MNRHSQNTHDDSTAFNIYRKTCLNAVLTEFHSGDGFVVRIWHERHSERRF